MLMIETACYLMLLSLRVLAAKQQSTSQEHAKWVVLRSVVVLGRSTKYGSETWGSSAVERACL